MEKSPKKAKWKRCGALLYDECGTNGGKNPESNSGEESKVLHHVLIESWRSEDGPRSSSGGGVARTANEDGIA